MRTALLLALAAVAATLLPGHWLELQRGGAAWRIVTCHFTHWSHEQLAWDGLAFVALAAACARRDRAAFHATLLASIVAVPLTVLAFAPNVATYRGLSGIDSALFALLLTRLPRRWPAVLCLSGLAAKIAFEALAHHTVFVQNLGAGVVPVPLAHVAGAAVGVAIGFVRSFAPLAGRRRPKAG